MPHSVAIISTIAGAFGVALLLGYVAVRLRLPALVGYLAAGFFVGPFTPGITADLATIQQLAELGVMLLMFGVGMHLSVDELLAVRRIAIPGALAQMLVAALLGAGLAMTWGWSRGAALVFGLSLCVASTVVVLRALEARGALTSLSGRIAVGWLVVEDIVMVVALVLLPPLAGLLDPSAATAALDTAAADAPTVLRTLAETLGRVLLFVVLMFVVGRRVFPWILMRVAGTGSRELFTLAVMAAAVGIAYAAGAVFGVSFALGAFIAGMVLGESEFGHRAADESLPFRDAFAVLFFVSVGMLFDPSLLWREPLRVLLVLGVIYVGNGLAATALVLASRYPLNTALTIGASLSQVGEFSFILAGVGVTLGLLPVEGQNLILAGAVVSIALNPLLFRVVAPMHGWILERSRLARLMERSGDRLAELPSSVTPTALTGHILIVGYGRVGRRIGERLMAQGIPIVVAERNRETVSRLRASGVNAIAGDATDPAVLIQAHVARAQVLVIATPDAVGVRAMMRTAHQLRPLLPIIVRTHSEDEADDLRREPNLEVYMGEAELAQSMTRAVLEHAPPPVQL